MLSTMDAHNSETVTAFILTAICSNWKEVTCKQKSLAELIKESLTIAGLPLLGIEAIRLHYSIFKAVFFGDSGELTIANNISVKDYFGMITDECLGWMTFLVETLPYMRLTAANAFLAKLEEYVIQDCEEDSRPKGTHIKLLLAALMLVDSIVLDLVSVDRIFGCSCPSVSVCTQETLQSKKEEQFERDAKVLADHKQSCLELLLKFLNRETVHLQLVQDVTIFQQTVELLSLSLIVVDPFVNEEETLNTLDGFYVGKKNIVKLENKETRIKRSSKDDFASKDQSSNDDPETVFVPMNRNKNVNLVECQEFKEGPSHGAGKGFCSRNIMIHLMKSFNNVTLFCDLVNFFCRGEWSDCDNFYTPLSGVLKTVEGINFGLHVISGQKLYSHLVKQLRSIVDGTLYDLTPACSTKEILSYIREKKFKWPSEFLDLARFRMTEVELLLESGRILSGKEDLQMIKRVVSGKEIGWRDLLVSGLKNVDILGWWENGFFELVWHHEAVLSKEENITLVLKALCLATKHHPGLEITTRLSRLFQIMFHRLSTSVQEHMVLLLYEQNCNESLGLCLHDLKNEQEILAELIPLLNKLTSSSVDRLMSNLLLLSLYNITVVLKQVIHIAIENKAQVDLIVEVLRRTPNICKFLHQDEKQSLLIKSCLEVLTTIEMNDNRTRNTIQFLSLLSQAYNLQLDIDSNTSVHIQDLISPADNLEYFILPGLKHKDKTGEGRKAVGDLTGTHSTSCRAPLCAEVALPALAALLEKIDESVIVSLQPFPLLVVLADLYVETYVIIYNDELNRVKLTLKQASQKCILLLSAAIAKYPKLFPESSFCWLKTIAVKSGWLHVALLKPVLDLCCDLEMHSMLAALTRKLMLIERNGVRMLVLLTQLALVNDEMLIEVKQVINHTKFTAGSSTLLTVVSQVLLVSLPSEMHRLVNIMTVFLSNQKESKSRAQDQELVWTTLSHNSRVCLKTSQLLTDATLLLNMNPMSDAALCHIVTNYQAGSQILVAAVPSDIQVLSDFICHYCSLLYIVEGQAAQILQVSALDVMTRIRSVTGAKGNATISTVNKPVEQVVLKRVCAVVQDYLSLVKDQDVKSVLLKQVMDVFEIC